MPGSVGLGDIAGAAVAVGPGAAVWMAVAGLFGMATRFTECSQGGRCRDDYPDGRGSGGPMSCITMGFKERGPPGAPVLAAPVCIFAMRGALGGGAIVQASQAHAQAAGVPGDVPGWITGVVPAGVTFAAVMGGLTSIAKATEKGSPSWASSMWWSRC